jgi:(p)ppGpp synthase/HD superfamily hydrolase
VNDTYDYDMLLHAITIAYAAHEGQVDKVGEPYINHPRWVAHEVERAGFGAEVIAAAWLHDVVEDCDVSLQDLRNDGIPEIVVQTVDCLTKRKGEKFRDYYERVKSKPEAVAVKWFDVKHNSHPGRLSKCAPDTQDRLRTKYEQSVEILAPAYRRLNVQQG